ncbi:MAG TPA: cupin domain-containing protein [Acidimicrobiales bacterium]|nr:cupin domain-containing protein [Acidimicrobiales bacterium]
MPDSSDPGPAIRHVPAAARRADTAQSAGMVRYEGISGRTAGSERIWLGENHVAPHVRSADHHHGESESAIYVVAGHPVFVYAEGGVERRIEAGPGDYVFVPPYLPHREENPGTEEAFVILARSTQESIVVNLDGLDGPVTPPAPAATSGSATPGSATSGSATSGSAPPGSAPPGSAPSGDAWHGTEQGTGAP